MVKTTVLFSQLTLNAFNLGIMENCINTKKKKIMWLYAAICNAPRKHLLFLLFFFKLRDRGSMKGWGGGASRCFVRPDRVTHGLGNYFTRIVAVHGFKGE